MTQPIPKSGWRETFRSIFSGRMLVALVMGFTSGLPLLLTSSVLQAWLKDSGVSLAAIGAASLIGLPYTLKFLWAPLFDRFTLPLFGRRRGWLLLMQAILAAALVGLSWSNPATNLWGVALAALLVTFFSASQDIVVDAYRRESLRDLELGFGSALFVNGYRIGMLLAGGGGLILADLLSFPVMYQVMAAFMGVGIITTLLAREPTLPPGAPRTLKSAVIEPFVEFFKREEAWLILAFILFYKLGDTLATAISTPFYLDLGFTKTEIGAVVKLFGFWATILGGTLGGIWILRLGMYRALWTFGILQMLSTFGFVLLAHLGPHLTGLATVVAVENFTGGLGTAAFVGFMGAMTDKRFTATQYALLSSLMGVPRVILSAPTGWMAESMGWSLFFLTCTLMALPGLWLLRRFKGWTEPANA
ncbi:AmpG family muropeptide MFS transporter [Sulfuriferula plumbiphila]|uniref:AmpG family muropeptide MFS transporter n=1 Tax=Sulfuriferula plumbiphila TaxID=171865 RepID=A0A512L3G9_9PROT|nr:AmpG family muropeptide MFS transporter [Sulfuriferula plumbiphila]BBP02726.1 AmpG family muropeptide MFS transporter [Sulfuriferula plumbiphila]GEP29020.1 AmpG family muropeptide MFS transporter [Sulfuriferula plumbiphila]